MNVEHPTLDLSEKSLADTGPGGLLLGRYALYEVIGEGGMGKVYRATDRQFDRDVAIKLLKPGMSVDSPAASRFHLEAKITGQLQHPGIPPVYEIGTLPDGLPFLAMKLVKGRTLRDMLKDRSSPSVDLGSFIAIFEQVCHAVGYAHAHRVIHRDLKTSNIMVGAHGEVQVMDWGLAKVLDEPGVERIFNDVPRKETRVDRYVGVEHQDIETSTVIYQSDIVTPGPGGMATVAGSVLGTPAYMSAEQAAGDIHNLTARSDVFSLGAILCEMLTGYPPYSGNNPHEILLQATKGEMSEALERLNTCVGGLDLYFLCKRCLANKLENRPEDGFTVASSVAHIRQEWNVRSRQAEVENAVDSIRKSNEKKADDKRHGAIIAFVVGVAIIVLLGCAIEIMQILSKDESTKNTNARSRDPQGNPDISLIQPDQQYQEITRIFDLEYQMKVDEKQLHYDKAEAKTRMFGTY